MSFLRVKGCKIALVKSVCVVVLKVLVAGNLVEAEVRHSFFLIKFC